MDDGIEYVIQTDKKFLDGSAVSLYISVERADVKI